MDVMIDIETLGTRPDAQLLQIGAVPFEARSGGRVYEDKALSRYVAVQDGAGSIDHGTVAFWFQQISMNPTHPMATGVQHAVKMEEALIDLITWPKDFLGETATWSGVRTVWAKSPDFDLAILRSAFAKLGAEAPWDHRSTRDCRTLFDLVGGEPEVDWTGLTRHDAVGDAVAQCMAVQKAMARVTVK